MENVNRLPKARDRHATNLALAKAVLISFLRYPYRIETDAVRRKLTGLVCLPSLVTY